MIHLVCDLCGKTLLLDEDVRYVVNVEVFAAYDPMELTADDLKKDRRAELRRLIERMKDMDPEKVQNGVYRRMRFNLCPGCQKDYLKDPLRRTARDK